MKRSSCCSTFLSAFGVVSVWDFGDSKWCVVVSHCFNHLKNFNMEVTPNLYATEFHLKIVLSFKRSGGGARGRETAYESVAVIN